MTQRVRKRSLPQTGSMASQVAMNKEDSKVAKAPSKTKKVVVTVGRVPGDPRKVTLESDMSVRNALSRAEIGQLQKGEEVHVDGVKANMKTQLKNGQTVHIVQAVEGGCDCGCGSCS